MADNYELSALQERRQRERGRAERADPTELAKVAPEFAPAAAEQAREAAAKRTRKSRSMPDAFPVGGLSSEQEAPAETVAKLPKD